MGKSSKKSTKRNSRSIISKKKTKQPRITTTTTEKIVVVVSDAEDNVPVNSDPESEDEEYVQRMIQIKKTQIELNRRRALRISSNLISQYNLVPLQVKLPSVQSLYNKYGICFPRDYDDPASTAAATGQNPSNTKDNIQDDNSSQNQIQTNNATAENVMAGSSSLQSAPIPDSRPIKGSKKKKKKRAQSSFTTRKRKRKNSVQKNHDALSSNIASETGEPAPKLPKQVLLNKGLMDKMAQRVSSNKRKCRGREEEILEQLPSVMNDRLRPRYSLAEPNGTDHQNHDQTEVTENFVIKFEPSDSQTVTNTPAPDGESDVPVIQGVSYTSDDGTKISININVNKREDAGSSGQPTSSVEPGSSQALTVTKSQHSQRSQEVVSSCAKRVQSRSHCITCNISCLSTKNLKAHMKECHNEYRDSSDSEVEEQSTTASLPDPVPELTSQLCTELTIELEQHFCELCNFASTSQSELNFHKRQRHPETMSTQCQPSPTERVFYVCSFPKCLKKFTSFLNMQIHKALTHDNKPSYRNRITCLICPLHFSSLASLAYHLNSNHASEMNFEAQQELNKFTTPNKNEKIGNKKAAQPQHFQNPKNTNVSRSTCYQCNLSFQWEANLEEHIKECHSGFQIISVSGGGGGGIVEKEKETVSGGGGSIVEKEKETVSGGGIVEKEKETVQEEKDNQPSSSLSSPVLSITKSIPTEVEKPNEPEVINLSDDENEVEVTKVITTPNVVEKIKTVCTYCGLCIELKDHLEHVDTHTIKLGILKVKRFPCSFTGCKDNFSSFKEVQIHNAKCHSASMALGPPPNISHIPVAQNQEYPSASGTLRQMLLYTHPELSSNQVSHPTSSGSLVTTCRICFRAFDNNMALIQHFLLQHSVDPLQQFSPINTLTIGEGLSNSGYQMSTGVNSRRTILPPSQTSIAPMTEFVPGIICENLSVFPVPGQTSFNYNENTFGIQVPTGTILSELLQIEDCNSYPTVCPLSAQMSQMQIQEPAAAPRASKYNLTNVTRKNSNTTSAAKASKKANSPMNALAKPKSTQKYAPRHACELCPRKFTSKKIRDNHMIGTHWGTNQAFACHICKEVYNNKSLLSRHKNSAHPVLTTNTSQTSVCKYCGLVFEQQVELWKHETIHYEVPRPCPSTEVLTEVVESTTEEGVDTVNVFLPIEGMLKTEVEETTDSAP